MVLENLECARRNMSHCLVLRCISKLMSYCVRVSIATPQLYKVSNYIDKFSGSNYTFTIVMHNL